MTRTHSVETATMRRNMRTLSAIGIVGAAGCLALPTSAWAEEAATASASAATATPTINGADTAFMMICAALVMVMTPGLGFSTAAWCGGRTCWRRSSRASSCWA